MTDDRDFVEHPRFGREPRETGLNPVEGQGGVFLHWHSPVSCRIPNTAITADIARQSPSPVGVTHYFDVTRVCRDCQRPFIFYAEEQRHWYEELQFGLDSDCVRCVPCRKISQGTARVRQRYEDLHRIDDRSDSENLEMAECCMQLIEDHVFTPNSRSKVRALINLVERGLDEHVNFESVEAERIARLRQRVQL